MRLNRFIKEKNYEAAGRMFLHLMGRSKAYRIMLFNKTFSGWYQNRGMKDVWRIWNRLDRIILSWDANLMSKRVYIPKEDGRLRPLGVPRGEWRILVSGINDLLSRILPGEIKGKQFAYCPNTSIVKAWEEIWQQVNKNSLVYEFDLVSFFNKISIPRIIVELHKVGIPHYIVNYIQGIICQFPITEIKKFDGSEKELDIIRGENGNVEGIARTGIPQGLAISPLLAVFALDRVFHNYGVNPIMYADDGLVVINPKSEGDKGFVERYADKLYYDMLEDGVILSNKIKEGKPASRWIDDGIIKFIGITWDYKNDKILKDNLWVDRRKVDKKWIEINILKKYEGLNKEWSWTFNPESLLYKEPELFNEGWENWCKWGENQLSNVIEWIESEIADGKLKIKKHKHPVILDWTCENGILSHKGVRVFNYQTASSIACEWLLSKVKISKASTSEFRKKYEVLGRVMSNCFMVNHSDQEGCEGAFYATDVLMYMLRKRAKMIKRFYGTNSVWVRMF